MMFNFKKTFILLASSFIIFCQFSPVCSVAAEETRGESPATSDKLSPMQNSSNLSEILGDSSTISSERDLSPLYVGYVKHDVLVKKGEAQPQAQDFGFYVRDRRNIDSIYKFKNSEVIIPYVDTTIVRTYIVTCRFPMYPRLSIRVRIIVTLDPWRPAGSLGDVTMYTSSHRMEVNERLPTIDDLRPFVFNEYYNDGRYIRENEASLWYQKDSLTFLPLSQLDTSKPGEYQILVSYKGTYYSNWLYIIDSFQYIPPGVSPPDKWFLRGKNAKVEQGTVPTGFQLGCMAREHRGDEICSG